jgi:acyl carrier protein
MDLQADVIGIIGRVLDLGDRAGTFGADTHLLGSVPELDSMAVVALITSLEDHFGFIVEDDEIDGATFATVGSLVAVVQSKLTA